MNALQSLTGGPTAGAAGLGLPTRGPGQALGGMGGLGAMGQPVPLSGQPPPGASGMAPHSMAVVSTAAPQSEYTGGAGAVQPLPPEGGGVGGGLVPQPRGHALPWGSSAPPLQGQQSAPGLARPQASEGRERGCTALLGPWKVARSRAPRAPPPAPHRNIPVESPEPPRCRARRPCARVRLWEVLSRVQWSQHAEPPR